MTTDYVTRAPHVARNMQSYLRQRFADLQGPSPKDLEARRLHRENLRRRDSARPSVTGGASYVPL